MFHYEIEMETDGGQWVASPSCPGRYDTKREVLDRIHTARMRNPNRNFRAVKFNKEVVDENG